MAPLPPFTTQTTLPPPDSADAPPELAEVLLPGDVPVLLLPVRLETRFATLPDGSTELRVRVFPDTVHLDAHEPELTAAERDWGQHYWEQDWRGGLATEVRSAAWQQLADRFRAPRAAWIARATRPVNADQRPQVSTAPDADLPVAPQFPDTPTTPDDSAWRSAAQARLMPDRWVAVLSSSGKPSIVVTGRDVAASLAVGPDPTRVVVTVADNELAIDPAMAWLVDFKEAEAAGMGLRVAVPPAVLSAGIDSLHVMGVRAAGTPDDAAAAVAGLLDAHHYTDGLEILPFGTPSSNTTESRSGLDSVDYGHRRTFAAQIRERASLTADADALRLGAALGLSGDPARATLDTVVGADGTHDLDQRSMTSALWESSWGYFLSNLYGFQGTGLSFAATSWARAHATGFVRAAGPFPALRCGHQPYGVLPVTSLDLWQSPGASDATFLSTLRTLLTDLRDTVFRPQVTAVPRLGRRQGPADPDADLVDVMQVDGLSSAFDVRHQLGRHFLEHLRSFTGEDLRTDGFIPAQDAAANGPLRLLGLLGAASPPRITQHVFAEESWPVTAPVSAAESAFITGLLELPGIASIVGQGTTSLLQALVRHSLLREYAVAAAQLTGIPTLSTAGGGGLLELLREPELVDLVEGAPATVTWLRQLDGPLTSAIASSASSVRAYLEGTTGSTEPSTAALADTRQALKHLATLSDDRLRLLTAATLDAATDRLDAWITSLATRRLAELRASAPSGVRVGGYGWVENLRPDATPSALATPPGDAESLIMAPGDSGFIHAPTPTHAVAAALLRNAHLGATGTPNADSPFSIMLNSWGSREAARLLQGVRAGQPLGALLGYRFERSLHDVQLGGYLLAIRALAPLDSPDAPPSAAPKGTVGANNVVDGLALYRRWVAEPGDIQTAVRADGASDDVVTTIGACLAQLGEAVDALADALTAETAYQAARGNVSRTSSTLDTLARGETAPPELEVTRFPHSGTALTHRVVVLLPADLTPATGWPGGSSPRSRAEPVLDAWAGLLLSNPHRTRCTVHRVNGAGSVVRTATFPLADLALAALDVVHTAGLTGVGQQGSDLEHLVIRRAAALPAHPGSDIGVGWRIDTNRPADLPLDGLTFSDVLEQARAVHALLAGARAADADDLAPPERPFTDGADLTDLQTRLLAAEAALAVAHQALAQLTSTTDADPGLLATAMLAVGAYGIAHATPSPDADPATLRSLGSAVLQQSQARLDKGAELRALPEPSDARAQRTRLTDRMRAVFGPTFLTLLRITCGVGQAAELSAALTSSTQAQDGDPFAVTTWLTRIERVRDPVARLCAPLLTAEALGSGDGPDFAVAQLPYTPGVRWVALPAAPGTLPHGAVSLVVHRPQTVDPSGVLAAVLVDEWVELVPDQQETTALTFQLNPPNSVAPQSLLLAVPPTPRQDWTLGTLHRVLAETFDLAKLRAVRSESLDAVSQYLPAVILAQNTNQDAVSTDLMQLTRPEGS